MKDEIHHREWLAFDVYPPEYAEKADCVQAASISPLPRIGIAKDVLIKNGWTPPAANPLNLDGDTDPSLPKLSIVQSLALKRRMIAHGWTPPLGPVPEEARWPAKDTEFFRRCYRLPSGRIIEPPRVVLRASHTGEIVEISGRENDGRSFFSYGGTKNDRRSIAALVLNKLLTWIEEGE